MLTPITHFAPLGALGGGLLIGAAVVILLAGIGRIAGISGVLHGMFSADSGNSWRATFLIGLVAGAAFYGVLWPHDLPVREGFPSLLLIVAGLLVGAGTRLGSGCTSGHGICGIARRSKRSLSATAVFIASGVIAAVLLRHGLRIGP